jgi:hypothetical protein
MSVRPWTVPSYSIETTVEGDSGVKQAPVPSDEDGGRSDDGPTVPDATGYSGQDGSEPYRSNSTPSSSSPPQALT